MDIRRGWIDSSCMPVQDETHHPSYKRLHYTQPHSPTKESKPWLPQGLGSVWSASLTNHHQPSSSLNESREQVIWKIRAVWQQPKQCFGRIEKCKVFFPTIRDMGKVRCAAVIDCGIWLKSTYDFNIICFNSLQDFNSRFGNSCVKAEKMGTWRKQYNNYILPAYMCWWCMADGEQFIINDGYILWCKACGWSEFSYMQLSKWQGIKIHINFSQFALTSFNNPQTLSNDRRVNTEQQG